MTRIEQADLVVLGGGPAGLCAAIEARKAGVASVLVLDEGPAPGGQIFRRFGQGFDVRDARAAGHEYRDGEALIAEARAAGVTIRSETVVWGIWDRRLACVTKDVAATVIEAKVMVLCPGARDRPVAFQGWTLPGVITAGAAKIMVAVQRVLPGKRILMAGSGPLALAFSAQLRGYGAEVVEVLEAAPRPSLRQLARLVATGEVATLREALAYRLRLQRDGVPLTYGSAILRAEGTREVESAVVARVDAEWRPIPGTERAVEVDTIISGYGLEASNEVFRLLRVALRFDRDLGGWIPVKDAAMRTSLPHVFAAGDGSGIGGSRYAMAEGRIAGVFAASALGAIEEGRAEARAAPHRRRLERLARFRSALNDIYRVGPGLYELATAETVVCRCEMRTLGDLVGMVEGGVSDPNVVRARSRIGMGRCQGRNCASLVAAVIAQRRGVPVDRIAPLSARPPIKPVPLAAVADERVQHEAAVEVE